MPDTKITALTAIGANPIIPSTFPIPMVDLTDTSMAASGTTKKVTVNQILGAGGTATLASATISGDLTVRTNRLATTTTGVGIGTASPIVPLDVRGGAGAGALFLRTTDPTAAVSSAYIQTPVSTGFSALVPIYGFWYQNCGMGNPASDAVTLITASTERYRIDSAGTNTWSNVGGAGTAMTLNSTGLGIGAVPVNTRLDVRFPTNPTVDNAGGSHALRVWTTVAQAADVGGQLGLGGLYDATNYQSFATVSGRKENSTSGNNAGYFSVATCLAGGTMVERLRIDSSGNVLVGTTTNAGVRLDVQTATGNCIGRVKSNAAASTASFIIDYVETLGCTYIKKAGSDVWIYGVQNDTSATPAFKINTASNVGVQLVSGATAWTTLSDETVKDIIEPISNAVAKVGSIRSVIGKFKTDDSSKRRSFLIAQDVQSVLPEAVDVVGENNELGLRYTEVIPLLVAAIKELTARVQTLETR